jgi:hypothetical protein
MVQVYVSLIKAGLRTIDQVPEEFRADVEQALV